MPSANGHASYRTHAVAKSCKLGPKIHQVEVQNQEKSVLEGLWRGLGIILDHLGPKMDTRADKDFHKQIVGPPQTPQNLKKNNWFFKVFAISARWDDCSVGLIVYVDFRLIFH